MESVKKWLSERTAKKNGIYVHHSPPRVVGVVWSAQLRQWAREGRLERAVLAGQGRRLLEEAEALPLARHLPALVAKCDALHDSVEKGSLLDLRELLEADYNRRKYVTCRDEAGVGLLHKAIYYDFMDIADYLVKNYPQLVHMKDSEGRTPLHYTPLCRDEAAVAALLEGAGAARGARDAAGRTPAHYRGPARALLALPATLHDMARENRNPPGLVIKRHNIRIWCHDCDMARLQRVVWEGHGSRLLSEVSNQPLVKRFLEAVPYIMNTIRDIHTSVVENDLEGLMKHAGDPVPPQALSSRDANNMTVMHKAAGLGHSSILKYLAERFPQGINDVDNEGRTPLHYAAAMRDDQHTYNMLVSLGADESVVDNKNKTPAYYVSRPQEIDKSLLKTIPEAPRTPSSAYPSNWDWKMLDNYVITELNKKSRRKNFRASTENISSKNNTNTISDSTDNRIGTMKTSSTHELIKGLPELDEGNKPITEPEPNEQEKPNNEDSKETEVVEENENTEESSAQEEIKPSVDGANVVEHTTEETEQKEVNPSEDAANVVENTTEETEQVEDHTKELNSKEENNEGHQEVGEIDNKDTKGEDTDVTPINNDVTDDTHEDTETAEENNSEHDNVTTESPHDENNEISDKEMVTNGTDKETHVDIQENEHKDSQADENKPEVETTQSEENCNVEDKEGVETIIYSGKGNHEEEAKDQKEDEVETNTNIQDSEDDAITTNEGNNNRSDTNEDDDDVRVPGDSSSEYSEYNLKSTAEASDTGSAKIGNMGNGRNTQESLIEGNISGDAEQDSQDASLTQRDKSVHGEVLVVDNEIDPEVADLLNTANMEMLATLVLNGEGARLIGRRSGNSELQGFLDNVPIYMKKINEVHNAAREGNSKALQTALDRRKFAIARDPTSPNGSTPLHVATIFGKTNIMTYLGGRFPETLSAVDFEGRTALHYAAVLPDNGHFYNLLQQLGANSKDLDDNGRSAEDYYKNQSLLPFEQLLSDFGISDEAVQSMFADKGPAHHHNGHMDIPIFQTDEGRYLAKSLGDPLIKGLTEVANVKPKDPVAFLASFLHNFPEHEKPRIGTQESNVVIAQEAPEMENEQAFMAPSLEAVSKPPRSASRTATLPHRPIDVVTVDPQQTSSPDGPEIAFTSAKRDEHGQSMLHFAAARTHTRNALFQLLQESDVSIGYRDELYRTARDVSTQANVPENTVEIDRFVLHLAARGNTEKIMELLMEGYDHILDVVDEEGVSITDVIAQRGDSEMSSLLASIPAFEESRDILLGAVRRGDLSAVKAAIDAEGGRTLVRSQNSFGRTSLHVAVLAQPEEVVAYLAENCPELLRIGDNLERTPLHYAMGVQKIESLSRVLIRAGSKRVLKDLKGRQPTYYFMNKSDILRLQEEEEIY